MEILTTRGEVCLVSPKDYIYFKDKVIDYCGNYLRCESKLLHVLITERKGETLPKKSDKRCIDHINQNKLDNRRENLRVVSSSENNRNVDKPKGKYKSNYKGVGLNVVDKWKAAINKDGKVWKYAFYICEHHAGHQYNLWCQELNEEIRNEIPEEYIKTFKQWETSKNFHDHRNIKNTSSGRYQVEISTKQKRINATFDYLEDAIEFRDDHEKEIKKIRLTERKLKFRERIKKLDIQIDEDILEEIYIGIIRYRTNSGFVYVTMPGEKEMLLSKYIMNVGQESQVKYKDFNKRNLKKVNLYEI